MSLTFGFYNSLNGDRKYNAEQMSSLFDGVLQDGVFASIGQAMMVTAGTGMQVLVGTGRAWFNHTWTLNDAQMPLDIDASDFILKRIDAVVLEVNSNMAVRTNTIKVIKGTPASVDTAAKPAMTNTDGVFQHPLAYISVNPAASAITGGDIENVVGKDKETKFVTSICESVSIEDLFSQWTGQFTTWFDNIKAQLEGDVVTNLQRQIDENKTKVDRLDTTAMLKESKATNIESVVEDDLYVTPKYLDNYLTKKLPEKYTHLVIKSGDIGTENSMGISTKVKNYVFMEKDGRPPIWMIFKCRASGQMKFSASYTMNICICQFLVSDLNVCSIMFEYDHTNSAQTHTDSANFISIATLDSIVRHYSSYYTVDYRKGSSSQTITINKSGGSQSSSIEYSVIDSQNLTSASMTLSMSCDFLYWIK